MNDKKTFGILIIITILIYSTNNFAHPVTPAFLSDSNIPSRYFGILFSTMAFSLALFSPFWGNKGDSYGRKYIVAIGIAGYGIGQLFFGFGNSIQIILVGRVISGAFAAALFSNITASFSEISTDKTRARNMSVAISVITLSSSIGYYIGGALGVIFTPATTIIIQGFFAIFIALIVLLIYPKTEVISKERKSFIKNISLIKTIDDNILYFMFTILFWTFAKNNVSKFFDVYLNNVGFDSKTIGSYIMLTGITGAILTIIFVPRLARKFELLSTLKVLLILIIVTLITSFVFNNKVIMFISYMTCISLTAIYLSVEQTYLSKNISSNYGAILGVRESFKSIGLVTGPLVITFLFDTINANVFYFNALVYIIALLLLIRFIKLQNNKGSEDYGHKL